MKWGVSLGEAVEIARPIEIEVLIVWYRDKKRSLVRAVSRPRASIAFLVIRFLSPTVFRKLSRNYYAPPTGFE